MKLLRRSGALPQFDFYDDTVVTGKDWQRMYATLSEPGGETAEFVSELAAWIGDGFESNASFTISGV